MVNYLEDEWHMRLHQWIKQKREKGTTWSIRKGTREGTMNVGAATLQKDF